MKPPSSDPLTFEDAVIDSSNVPDFEEAYDASAFETLRRERREKVQAYPEPMELAQLAVAMAPDQCRKGRKGWLRALQIAREFFDDAINVAVAESDREREELRVQLQREYVQARFAEIETCGYLGFNPEAPDANDEYCSTLEKAGEEGYRRRDGFWFRWGMLWGQPDTEKKGCFKTSKLLLEEEMARRKKTKQLKGKLRRKKAM